MKVQFKMSLRKISLGTLVFLFFLSIDLKAQHAIGTLLNTEASFNGYTLITPTKGHKNYLINNCGEIINQWTSKHQSLTANYLTEDGLLINTCISPTLTNVNLHGAGGLIELYDWDNSIVWSYDFNTLNRTTNHDLKLLPNGNLLILFAENIDAEKTYQLGRKNKEPMVATVVREVKMLGNNDMKIVWEWKLTDHLIQNIDSNRSNFGNIQEHPERVNINFNLKKDDGSEIDFKSDFFHANAIDYNPVLDQILLTIKHYAEIWVIDHSTTTEEAKGSCGGKSDKGGDLLFRYGNRETYGAGIWQDRILFAPHGGVWIKEGQPNAGHFMIFNNGRFRPIKDCEKLYSNVIMVTSPFKMNGAYGLNLNYDATEVPILFQYGGEGKDHFYSEVMSSAVSLPNGNILINVAKGSRVLEVTPEKELAWDYIIPTNQDSIVGQIHEIGNYGAFNAQRYPTDMIGFRNKNLTPKGLLGSFNQDSLNCQLFMESKETDNTPTTF